MNDYIICKFCKSTAIITAGTTTCYNCDVQFNSFAITYYIYGPFYYSLVMYLNKEITIKQGSNDFLLKQIIIPYVYPETKPEDALSLAKQIYNLSALA